MEITTRSLRYPTNWHDLGRQEGKKRMKILLASFFQPSVGGYWNYINQLRSGLQQRPEYEVDLLCIQPMTQNYALNYMEKILDKDKVIPIVREQTRPRFKEMNISGTVAELETNIYGYRFAALYFGLSQYDLIHAQDVLTARSLRRVRPQHTPLITTIHGIYSDELIRISSDIRQDARSMKYCNTLEQWGVESSSLVIVPSHAMKNTIAARICGHTEKFRVVKHGMDIAAFLHRMNAGSSIAKSSNKKVIACVARLSEEKGPDVLIKALRKLKQEDTSWECWIIGDGPMMPWLKEMCQLWNLNDDVHFMGDRSDVPALLNQADLFVLASRQESLGYAVMEAQLAGKPIVAARTGGIPEIVEHGVTGLLSPSEDSEQLKNNLLELLRNHSLSQSLGERARAMAEQNYSLECMVDNTRKIYEEARRAEAFARSEGGS